ncbi:MAG TPA: serine/threonine-protein kinase [Trebonia sp.]|jgi:serine/threonine protein kinase|nr:serine/threonine-protein kinase [Trebonia sp.]
MELLTLADPKELGGIALRGRLGQGGMGVVYFGVTEDGEPVAVKTIRAENVSKPAIRSRFDREILAMGMVQGPRVAALVQACEPGADAQPWLAVEYVQGLTLAEYTEGEGTLPAELGAALGMLLAEALTEIHRVGLLHRDFKPGNIILGRDGPIVIDFGLVGLLDETGDITHTGDMLGTPHCMAPEQVRAQGHVTSAADVYALGVVLTYAMTGHYLYRRPDRNSLLFAIADPGTAPDLSGLPDPVLGIVQSMIAHEPTDRPALPAVTAALADVLAGSGLTPVAAQRRFAELTYVERKSDPSLPPRAADRARRIPRDPEPPKEIVQQVANDLRRDYSRDARF